MVAVMSILILRFIPMHTRWLALFLHDLTNSYQLMLRDDAEKTAGRFEHAVSVYSAERSADLQVQQIRAVLGDAKGTPPTALLVSPVREDSLFEVVREVTVAGIPLVILCRWYDELGSARRAAPKLPLFSVVADQTEIGRIHARILRQLVRPTTELVYIQGPQGTSSTVRRASAMKQELGNLTGVHWSLYNGDWSGESGAQAMKSCLSRLGQSKLQELIVCAQNDDMAFGARRALIDSGGLAQGTPPIVIGCDGLPNFGKRLVAEGQLTATVVVPSLAGRAIEELFATLRGGPVPPAEVNLSVECYPALARIQRPRQTARRAP